MAWREIEGQLARRWCTIQRGFRGALFPTAPHAGLLGKARGQGPQAENDTAAEIHAADRVAAGFTGEQVMAEYRALRSCVLRLWARQVDLTTADDIEDMVRFNEAMDQARTESMARYAKRLREAQNLFLAILGHDVRTPLGAAHGVFGTAAEGSATSQE